MHNNRFIPLLASYLRLLLCVSPCIAVDIPGTPTADPVKSAEAQKLKAEADHMEMETLSKQTDTASMLLKKSQHELATKRTEAHAARRKAAKDIGIAQKKHQKLRAIRAKFEERAKQREKDLEDREKASQQKLIDQEARKVIDSERKSVITEILSELLDVRNIQRDASETTDLEKLQAMLKKSEERLNNAQTIHAKWRAQYSEPLPQAEEVLKDLGAAVGTIKEFVQKATVSGLPDQSAKINAEK
ncbi:MAG: hypothetical protein H6849_03180 [Alphaproteobacteria bacterium]|nr:MAG: hypothetical protein H6849_03180 [Alphaproteobacteria bacterium]